jgi:hypothetical protein
MKNISVIEENLNGMLYVKPLAGVKDYVAIVNADALGFAKNQLAYDATKAALIAEALVQAAAMPGVEIAAFVGENYVVTVKGFADKVLIKEYVDGQIAQLAVDADAAFVLANALDNFAANWDVAYA